MARLHYITELNEVIRQVLRPLTLNISSGCEIAGLEIKKKIQSPFCDWRRKSSRKFTNFNRKTN